MSFLFRDEPKLADLVDLAEQMAGDEQVPMADRQERDRQIGQRPAVAGRSSRGLVLAWLREVRPEQESRGTGAERANYLTGALLALIGLLVGMAAATAAFHYDGTHPVNVVTILAVFVGLQVLLLLLMLMAAMPSRWLGWLPGFRWVQQELRSLSPGRLQGAIARFLPASRRDDLQAIVGRDLARRKLFARVHRWSVLQWAQVFAVAFNLGAIACALALVVFRDLAFGWSTTLAMEPDRLHTITSALATPWAAAFPDAVPTDQLIKTTRYFRLQDHGFVRPPGAVPPEAGLYGQWWSFLLAAMLVYGLLPRVLTWALARWRLRAAIRHAFDHVPGLAELRYRLQPHLSTQAIEAEAAGSGSAQGRVSAAVLTPASGRAGVINWADLPIDDASARGDLRRWLGLETAVLLPAGGRLPPEEDRRVIEQMGAAADLDAVAVLVRSWEPPVLELLDFLRDLRQGLGKERSIRVVPVGLSPDGQAIAPRPDDLRQWRDRVATLADPAIVVSAVGEEAGR